MSIKRFIQILACLAIAVGVTGTTYVVDRARQQSTQLEQGLRWARQIAAQADSLTLEAREKNPGSDALGRAARLLSQGTDSRVLSVTKFHSETSNPSAENYTFDAEKGVLDYTKFIDFEDNTGLRIRLTLGETGFLGARTQLAHDLGVGSLFLLLFLVCFAYSGPFFGFRQDRKLRERVIDWLVDAKGALTQLGAHIRELIKDAGKLAAAARASQESVVTLRDKVHAELTTIRGQCRGNPLSLKSAQKAEVIARYLASALRDHNGPLPAMSAELHRLVLEMLKTQAEITARLRAIETRLEPIATDADIAFHAYDTVFQTTEQMGAQIKRTTETLLDQARLMRDLKNGTDSR